MLPICPTAPAALFGLRIVNGDRLCDGDIAVLNVVLDDINESSIVIKCDFLSEIRAVRTSCPSGRI